MRTLTFLIVFFLSSFSVAAAPFGSGNWLKEELEKDERNDTGWGAASAFGYVHGSANVLSDSYFNLICIPPSATNGQIAAVVLKYLRSNPEELDKRAHVLVYRALKTPWGCKKTSPDNTTPNTAKQPKPTPKAKPKEQDASPF